ncbi:MAG: hypothetical protein MJ252_10760 [archaeon]|nr:hypothetical protein [archaeon]
MIVKVDESESTVVEKTFTNEEFNEEEYLAAIPEDDSRYVIMHLNYPKEDGSRVDLMCFGMYCPLSKFILF